MSVIGINSKKGVLSKVPTPPSILGAAGKRKYKEVARILIENEILKNLHLPTLLIYAMNYEQWDFSIKKIKALNKKKAGDGWVQTFKTGAQNITAWVTLKRDAEKAMLQCTKLFGLDPTSEKALKLDPNQIEIPFGGFGKKRRSN